MTILWQLQLAQYYDSLSLLYEKNLFIIKSIVHVMCFFFSLFVSFQGAFSCLFDVTVPVPSCQETSYEPEGHNW